MTRREEKYVITGELKNKIDSLWEIFWTGGLTNPLDVIEQMTYLCLSKTWTMQTIYTQKKRLCLDCRIKAFLMGKYKSAAVKSKEVS